MKKLSRSFLFLGVAIIIANLAFGQGKFAGPVYKKLIGKKYSDIKNVPGLKGYQLLEGTVLTDQGDPQPMVLEVYWKDKSRILLFANVSDSATTEKQILDVLVIKNVDPQWVVKIGTCRDGAQDNIEIVALLKPGYQEYSTEVKQAWRCNRDKIRFEAITVIKRISCLNEGFEQE